MSIESTHLAKISQQYVHELALQLVDLQSNYLNQNQKQNVHMSQR